MSYSIANVLYDWLTRRRHVSVVARTMGMNESTLLAKPNPGTSTAKLSADELIPLFAAIRQAGYGEELEGIAAEYTRRLCGEFANCRESSDIQQNLLRLMSAIGAISSKIVGVSAANTEKDLVPLLNGLRTDVLPLVVELEAVLADRLKRVRHGAVLDDPIPVLGTS